MDMILAGSLFLPLGCGTFWGDPRFQSLAVSEENYQYHLWGGGVTDNRVKSPASALLEVEPVLSSPL